ncbi:MAG: response regulator [Deltaproteobacteria bacterium]|nr:response regulator [Deltaproteobacteria bacterium]
MCGVSRPAVVEWIRRGLLVSRTTEGGHRRVPRRDLALFLEAHGYALPRSVERRRPLVFLVDDERTFRGAVAEALGDDYELRGFAFGPELLVACGVAQPDVVVVDLRMPGVCAPQLLEALGSAEPLQDTLRVALATADEELLLARRCGAQLAVLKRDLPTLRAQLDALVVSAQRRTGGASVGVNGFHPAETS